MAVADSKRFQTCINLLYERVTTRITEADAVAALIRQAIIDEGLTDFFTAGELTALQTFVSELSALAGSAVVAKIAAEYMASHRGDALTIEGVND